MSKFFPQKKGTPRIIEQDNLFLPFLRATRYFSNSNTDKELTANICDIYAQATCALIIPIIVL
jgi:hypothetical protein